MNCGKLQVIILLQFWYEYIAILFMENPFLSEKTLMAAEKPFKTDRKP